MRHCTGKQSKGEGLVWLQLVQQRGGAGSDSDQHCASWRAELETQLASLSSLSPEVTKGILRSLVILYYS